MEDLPASMIASVDPPTHKHPKKANITWKNSVKRFNQLFWLGLKDALQWETAVKLIKSSPEIKDLLWKSFMLNFCLFIVSLVLRHYYYELLLSLLSQSQSILVSNVGYYFSHFLLLLYDILWIFPMYLISFWLNGLWYSEVSRLSYQWAVAQHLRPSVRAPGLSPWKLIAELLYSSLVLACYVLQAGMHVSLQINPLHRS
jgi:etoposide-induced 2.4 mRNA